MTSYWKAWGISLALYFDLKDKQNASHITGEILTGKQKFKMTIWLIYRHSHLLPVVTCYLVTCYLSCLSHLSPRPHIHHTVISCGDYSNYIDVKPLDSFHPYHLSLTCCNIQGFFLQQIQLDESPVKRVIKESILRSDNNSWDKRSDRASCLGKRIV